MIPKQCLTPLSFIIKSAIKADVPLADKKNAYLHFPKCSTELGKAIRAKHHHVPYNRPKLDDSHAGTASGDTKLMASCPAEREK